MTGLRPVRHGAARQAKRAGAMGIVGGLANIGIAAATGGFGGGGEGAINAGEKRWVLLFLVLVEALDPCWVLWAEGYSRIKEAE